jgi:hypothetical protein
MKAFLIDPDTRSISEQSYDGQPNSIYTLFGSLLVDSNAVLHEHMVYSGGEAFEKGEKGFFLGEKLFFGKALVTGYAGFEEIDAAIGASELEALTMFDLPEFYEKTLQLLPADFSFDERYELGLDELHETVTPEWVFYVFNMADAATKSYFLNHLETAKVQGEDLHDYLKKMGNLALKSAR